MAYSVSVSYSQNPDASTILHTLCGEQSIGGSQVVKWETTSTHHDGMTIPALSVTGLRGLIMGNNMASAINNVGNMD